MQRAEYLADVLAGSIAGSGGVIALHDTLLARPVVDHAVQRAARNRDPADNFRETLVEAMEAIPARERDRRRRAAILERTRARATHPPTAMRIGLLESRIEMPPRVELGQSRSQSIDTELAARYAAAGERRFDQFRDSLYR
jgi:hypothetical protein